MIAKEIKMIWTLVFSISAMAGEPAPFPVFLKQGFSTVLKFETTPKKIVLGDSQSFLVEKTEDSLVIKPLVPFATGNLFVFFAKGEPRVFLLTASDDAEPTLYRKFEELKELPQATKPQKPTYKAGLALVSSTFDEKKDFLALEVSIAGDSKQAIRPAWNRARLKFKNLAIPPSKLWAQRKEVQRDTRVLARFVFIKPNVPRNLSGAVLVIPVEGAQQPLTRALGSN